MNFSLEFAAKDIIESRKLTDKSGIFIIFHKGINKSRQLDTQLSFILSKSVQELILSDPTTNEIFIPKDSCSDDFFDYFFSTIETNTIHIANDQIRDFISLVRILKIECIKPSIDSSILSLLCEPFHTEQFTNDEEKFDFLCKHMNEIDIETFKIMPYDFIYKLITNSTFQKEDDRAKFLLKNTDFFNTTFLNQINFDDLSNEVLNEMIPKIKFDISQDDQLLYDKIMNRFQKYLGMKEINVLVITMNERPLIQYNYKNIDFSFIDYLNRDQSNDKYKINCKTIINTDFNNKKDYMNFFDIVVIGGCDSYSAFNPDIKQNEIESYHNNGGILMFLHDVVTNSMNKKLENLVKFIGFNGNVSNAPRFNEVKLNEICDKNDILQKPFNIESPIKVAETHITPNYTDPKYSVLVSKNGNYYVENLDEHVADCTMGHSPNIPESEQKLFYNLICHLYENCHDHQVKTII